MAISSCSDRMAKEKSVIPIERIAAQIYVSRGESVMLDADLAELYHVETGRYRPAEHGLRTRRATPFQATPLSSRGGDHPRALSR